MLASKFLNQSTAVGERLTWGPCVRRGQYRSVSTRPRQHGKFIGLQCRRGHGAGASIGSARQPEARRRQLAQHARLHTALANDVPPPVGADGAALRRPRARGRALLRQAGRDRLQHDDVLAQNASYDILKVGLRELELLAQGATRELAERDHLGTRQQDCQRVQLRRRARGAGQISGNDCAPAGRAERSPVQRG